MAVISALFLFAIWMLATYLLEGRRRTTLRPEAARDRFIYTFVANVLVGTLGSALLISRVLGPSAGPWVRTASMGSIASPIIAALGLGLVLLIVQRVPTWNPVVLLNIYSQTFVVSIAEVLVCWTVLGSAVAFASSSIGTGLSTALGLATASIAFGLYHFAHSPPFNQARMVILLVFVGLATGAFYALSRNVYATILFHNFLALKGVAESLSKAGLIDKYTRLHFRLIATSLLALALLVLAHVMIVTPAP